MKAFQNQYRPFRMIFTALCVSASMLSMALTSSAQFNSPVGTWDFVIGGSGQQGIAIITFNDENYTFSGHEMMTVISKSKVDSFGRGNDGRTPSSDTNSLAGGTNLFGYSPISGQWFYDSKGRVVGNYSIEVGSGESTEIQGISFTGKVIPGRRFNLVASTQDGKLAYKGIPFQQVSDLTDYWTGTKIEGKQTFIELFALSAIDVNVYNMDGVGPAYSYSGGICMVSAQKKIGFTLLEVPSESTNAFLRASVGSFANKPGKTTGKTKGAKETLSTNIKFNAARATFVP